MTDRPETTQPDPALVDRIARLIAAAIWCPQPDMSGDIWRRLGPGQRRRAEDAAVSAIEEARRYAI
jgi:predicted RNase H-like nuclease (RuvC/YqgF family)